ncbi:aldo/keto reductase [Myxococcus sp. K38C18041901]|uniref:aldo/keto reductase n=1 Tax=Myxococcus guangdongensis TaxID=2906760 RepID=UPI0020A7D912|nr:aldo/keto reductase [Myxococcus guangdongensis]MCP3063442.1 aldo/keto reductase [Myxococcus guangdongensis]
MRTRRLGSSDLDITPLGLGAWVIGGSGWQYTWGSQDDAESIEAIRHALDSGINWIDTAALYGLGHSEEVVARALEGRQPRPYVFTKCGMVWDAQGRISKVLEADSVRRECEASLRRLRVDAIDLYQIHWPVESLDVIEEVWTAMEALKREGKIRWAGVSNFNTAQLERAGSIAPPTALQPPYSLIRRDIEQDILPFCERHGIGVIVYSPMASGLLTGSMTHARVAGFSEDDWRRRNASFQEPELTRNLALVEFLREVGQRHGRSPAEVAIAWTLRNPVVTGAIVGARSAAQVDGFIQAGEFRLTADEVREVEDFLRRQRAS